MKRLFALIVAPLLLGNGFDAHYYELSAKLIQLISRGNRAAARELLAKDPKIYNWHTGENTSFDQFADFIVKCPIKDIRANKDLNINVDLDCGPYDGAALMFSGYKIKEIDWGAPPVIETVVTPASGAQH